jgi:hypothetical protein
MERHNRFDETMRAKLGTLEDEPSRRVWAGVSNEIGIVRPPQANPWIFRVAAAIAVLVLVGGGYLLLPKGGSDASGLALQARTKARHLRIVPLDRMQRSGVYLTEGGIEGKTPDAAPQHGLKHSFAQNPASKFENPSRDSLNRNSPAPFGPGLDPSLNDKVIANQDVPQPEKSPKEGPQNQAPDPGGNKSLVPIEVLTPDPKAIASNNSKRSIKLPGRDDLSPEGLRRKSGAILGAVTNGANEFLGLNASYKEKKEDDLKMTAFNADFGLFKIKRVKTVKQ